MDLLRGPKITHDIELPNESGKVDPRLPKQPTKALSAGDKWEAEKAQLQGVGKQLKASRDAATKTGILSRSMSKR